MSRPRIRAARRAGAGLGALVALAAGLAPGSAVQAAAPSSESEFRAHIEELVQAGRLGFEQGLLLRFQRAFSPAELPEDLESPDAWPAKSATSLVIELGNVRDMLSRSGVAAAEGYLRVSTTAATSLHETDRFRLLYETEGDNAVPLADVAPANGIPDYVERVGEYAELSHAKLVTEAGFSDPIVSGAKYEILFREMNSYGYTLPVKGTTRILLHHDFEGFPANDDPDGAALGAAKVTVAHELKHASQYVASGWTEGGWLEADATWAEDFVFDDTNDYLRYLPLGSPVSHPHSWLEGGVASYEDCLFLHLLAELHGPGILADLFERRSGAAGEPVLASFHAVLAERGSSLEEAARKLGLWSFFCGANSWQRPEGFEEAASYPTPPFGGHLFDPTQTIGRGLGPLGMRHVIVSGVERAGHPRVSFAGDESSDFAVHAIATDRAGSRTVFPIPLESSRAVAVDVPVEWEDAALFVVTVTRLEGSSSNADFFLSVGDDHAVGVGSEFVDGRFVLMPNHPNPFRAETSISFALGAPGEVRLSVYDVSGRLVKRLVEGESLAAGEHARTWNGLDEVGRLASPGLYYYRLESGSESASRKMLLLR